MILDYPSMLLAVGFSGTCLGMTLFGIWLSARAEGFLLTWALAAIVLVMHVLAYWVYTSNPSLWLCAITIALLPFALSFLLGAAFQFLDDRSPLPYIVVPTAIVLALQLPLLLAGYDGIAIIVEDIAAAALLIGVGAIYAINRREAPMPMTALAVLYIVCGISFALCAAVLFFEGQWVIGHAPDNWAERLNIMLAIAGLTGAGALSMALNQSRSARKHQAAALTDALTGLSNRRFLFSSYEGTSFGPDTAIALFDLDHFKQINDAHGHAAGDDILRHFASILRTHGPQGCRSVRLGGEEFALVLSQVNEFQAREIVERISTTFGSDKIGTCAGPVAATVSAGIGFGQKGGASLEAVLARADDALYAAKRAGRNRVEFGPWRMVS